ncbi:transcription elongation factor SPT4-A-like protein [Dinothrombium tinctorium]|uniref:Transcription elongation factor SPT4 n=1 Tax=Dinothrombium tinctorium TaxID=1965070 RepID=A0A3S3RJ20_9ACAR|nr:transcription elongation factor SPT4-A-like protein [Dinothrombium tinctorium]
MSVESIPRDLRNLRACLLCSLIKSFEQFEYDGCDNCEEILGMKNNREMIYDCTSSNFDGFVALTSPDESWVAKWLKISRMHPGIYAISVSGKLPPGVIRELKSRGIPYKPRDRTNV